MGERVFFDEVLPFKADAERHAFHERDAAALIIGLRFVAHTLVLAVLMYGTSFLPLNDRTPAYVAVGCAYVVAVIGWLLSNLSTRSALTQAELMLIHDEVMAVKYEARERGDSRRS